MIASAATKGWSIPSAAPTAAAAATRPTTESATQPTGRSAARAGIRLRRARTAPTAIDRSRYEQRPERERAGEGADEDERPEHDRARSAERDERAARRLNRVVARDEAREERESQRVARARGHKGVDEGADAVAGGRVGQRRPSAAEADGRAPGAGGADDGEHEADGGEPEPARVGAPECVERALYPRPEELRRRHRNGERAQQERPCGEAAPADPPSKRDQQPQLSSLAETGFIGFSWYVRGAIAAGHPLTAAAGAAVLEAGGNAVDACVAAAFTSWVCESMLTGPGGGGFFLVHAGGETVVFDAFVAVPREHAETELIALAVDFDGDTQQVFHTGPGSAGVPGTALGLEAAHARFGSLPWAELAAPAAAAGARRRGADAGAGLSPPDPRPAAAPFAGGRRVLRRAPAEGRRGLPPAGSRARRSTASRPRARASCTRASCFRSRARTSTRTR